MSMVPSVEALSTTMTSLRGYFWASTDSRQRLMNRPLSNVTIVTETKSLCAMNKNLSVRALYTSLSTRDHLEPDRSGPSPQPNKKQRLACHPTFAYAARG